MDLNLPLWKKYASFYDIENTDDLLVCPKVKALSGTKELLSQFLKVLFLTYILLSPVFLA